MPNVTGTPAINSSKTGFCRTALEIDCSVTHFARTIASMSTGLKIGIVAAALSQDPRKAAVLSRKLGFDGMVFDAYSPHFSLPELSQSGRREFKQVLSAQDLQLIGLRADLEGKGFSPSTDIERMLARVDRAMEAAVGMGSPLVCVDLGPLPEPARKRPQTPKINPAQAGTIIIPTADEIAEATRTGLEEEIPADSAFEASVDAAMAELGRRADRYSATVAFQSDLSSFAALDRALRKADCPWFGVELDPVAILRDRWGTDEVFSRLGAHVRMVRARDASVGHDRRTRPTSIDKGDVDWAQFLALLDEAGYGGWIVIDPLELADRTAGAQAGWAALRGMNG
jgi:sugar phosphate isomerase/epimerase